jgi:hypothetical protein
VDYYEISMKQITEQILPLGSPRTTVWEYGAVKGQRKNAPLIHNAPSLTIEAQWKRPVRIKWINDLTDDSGHYLPHLLPVDQTLHWANPPGGEADRDKRPTFTETPGPHTGPVPIVTHVHGAVGVGDESDGYAEAWYLPDANNIPGGYATEGTWYDFFKGKAASSYGAAWGGRVRHLPVPERKPCLDDLVPRSRSRDDAAQRLRRPGRFLHHPRRSLGRQVRARQPLQHDSRPPGSCSKNGPTARLRLTGGGGTVSLDRPVVLNVDRDPDTRDRVGRWLEDAGLDVVACPGPTAPEFTCIGSRDGHCPLAQKADLIVLDLWLDSDAAMIGTRAWNLVRFYRS